MKLSFRLEILIFLAIGLVLSSACSRKAEETEWSANIEIVDGIKVVKNPAQELQSSLPWPTRNVPSLNPTQWVC